MTATSIRATASYTYVASREAWASKFADKAGRVTSFEGAGLYNKATGEILATNRDGVCAPYVIGDCPDHIGPSGRIVTSRSNQRDEFKRSDTLPWEPINDRPRGFIDPAVVKQRNTRVCDNTLDWVHKAARKGLPKAEPLSREARRKVIAAQKDVLHKHGISD